MSIFAGRPAGVSTAIGCDFVGVLAGAIAGALVTTLFTALSTALFTAFATTLFTGFATTFALGSLCATPPLLVAFAATFAGAETTFDGFEEGDPFRPSGLLFIGL